MASRQRPAAGTRPRARTPHPPPPPLAIEISGRTGAEHVPFLRRNLARAHAILRPALRDFSLALVGDRRMAELHEQFMNIPGPTDVLTFELDHDARGRVTAGEVVVCVPYARREAARGGVPLRKELLLYALHGMLHLCGFDDRTDRDFATMHRREDQILSELGVGPVFAKPPADRAGAARPGASKVPPRRPTGKRRSETRS